MRRKVVNSVRQKDARGRGFQPNSGDTEVGTGRPSCQRVPATSANAEQSASVPAEPGSGADAPQPWPAVAALRRSPCGSSARPPRPTGALPRGEGCPGCTAFSLTGVGLQDGRQAKLRPGHRWLPHRPVGVHAGQFGLQGSVEQLVAVLPLFLPCPRLRCRSIWLNLRVGQDDRRARAATIERYTPRPMISMATGTCTATSERSPPSPVVCPSSDSTATSTNSPTDHAAMAR
jgi:hypothetical protein